MIQRWDSVQAIVQNLWARALHRVNSLAFLTTQTSEELGVCMFNIER